MNTTRLKTRPQPAVEGRFEGWRFTVNSSTPNTRPHRAVELPFPARRGGRGVGGESGGCSARIAISLIAARAGVARARGPNAIQRPCGNRLQKLQRLVHSPPLPQPLSTPAGAERGANNRMWPTLCLGWRSRADANIQTCREPRECGTPLMLPAFTLKVG